VFWLDPGRGEGVSGEIYRTPKSWTERTYRKLIYFNEVDKGDHFAAWEQLQLHTTSTNKDFCSVCPGFKGENTMTQLETVPTPAKFPASNTRLRGAGPNGRIPNSSTTTRSTKAGTSRRGSNRSSSRWSCARLASRFAELMNPG